MVDIELLQYLEEYLTENRKKRFSQVLDERTKHFTVAVEDVYQLHNTSAVIRSCDVFGIQEVHIIEEINRKRIDREIAMGAKKWVDLNRYNNVKDCIKSLKNQGYQIVATTFGQGHVHCVLFGCALDEIAFLEFGMGCHHGSDGIRRECPKTISGQAARRFDTSWWFCTRTGCKSRYYYNE